MSENKLEEQGNTVASPRYDIILVTKLKNIFDSDFLHKGITLNLSESGLLLCSQSKIPVDIHNKLSIFLKASDQTYHESFDLEGEVVRHANENLKRNEMFESVIGVKLKPSDSYQDWVQFIKKLDKLYTNVPQYKNRC
ncbi:MAG: PilZ domain-containing protein [Oligoflexales bacterium]